MTADRLETTVVTPFELLSGDAVRKLVRELAVLPLERSAAERAASIRQQLERTGESIGMADRLIAGIAFSNGLPLFTQNRRHFEKVTGLRLIDVA